MLSLVAVSRGYSIAVRRLLIVVGSLVAAHRLGAQAAAVAACGFSSRGRVDSVALWHVDSSPTRV